MSIWIWIGFCKSLCSMRAWWSQSLRRGAGAPSLWNDAVPWKFKTGRPAPLNHRLKVLNSLLHTKITLKKPIKRQASLTLKRVGFQQTKHDHTFIKLWFYAMSCHRGSLSNLWSDTYLIWKAQKVFFFS